MVERTCPVCNEGLPEGAHGRRVYCSRKCSQWHARNFNRRGCSEPGCEEPRRAKGLCVRHYNDRHQPQRHKKASVACSGCGVTVEKYPAGRRRPVCSDRCRYFVTHGRWPSSKELVHVGMKVIAAPPTPVTVVTTPRWWAVITQGSCAWCREQFAATAGGARYCSARCSRNAGKAKTRFVIPPQVRRAIYERDNWTCQLCFEPIDREAHYLSAWAPSLDHIEPQSHALIPDHSPANLRTAHMWCNSVRGNESHYTAADLVA